MLPSNDPRGLHPALANAIYLVVCSGFGAEMERFEAFFLQQAREGCRMALSMMDRLDQYFLAQVLEASYLLRMGRLQEAYVLASSSYWVVSMEGSSLICTLIALLRFALACDLHSISNPRQHLSTYAGLLGAPYDIYQVAEHINIWWSCYNLARRLATVTGLPDGLPDLPDIVSTILSPSQWIFNPLALKVTTVFPVPFSQIEQVYSTVPIIRFFLSLINVHVSWASTPGLKGQCRSFSKKSMAFFLCRVIRLLH